MDASAKTLLARRLTLFGVPSEQAARIAGEGRIAHRFGLKKRDVEHVRVPASLSGLALAEHCARVFHNWARCYHVDTTRLAMAAREPRS